MQVTGHPGLSEAKTTLKKTKNKIFTTCHSTLHSHRIMYMWQETYIKFSILAVNLPDAFISGFYLCALYSVKLFYSSNLASDYICPPSTILCLFNKQNTGAVQLFSHCIGALVTS